MSTETVQPEVAPRPDLVTRRRVGIVGLILALTSVAALPGGLLWPSPAGGGENFAYSDIFPVRDRWWGLLVFLSANLILNVLAQAIATIVLVRRRGAAWATIGGLVMWVGTALYAVGVGGWAAAYYFATDPAVGTAAGTAVMDSMSEDMAHLFGPIISGSLLVAIGTVIQVVGLWRSKAVPRWIPLLWLMIVPTFIIPGNGAVGLITAVPMTAAAIGTGYYAWRRAG
ncbi:MAG TPA: hypothetical protein VFG33_04625 [Kribbella sp.]|uniref:DUF4386 family protein n=1 Tax=Kribbella sp. TaxID=1871183 RepID=UPI002D77DC88|nr:hypothetical protein [Kribbella sp.]HET6292629.1 hypothetical protein [Kribbella sp.]